MLTNFVRYLKPAANKCKIKCLLADAGYDSESNHRYAREVCHIKTIIPAKHGRLRRFIA
jgi:hypothetical protein